MVIYFGADHGGFALKEKLKAFVKEKGYEVVDVGAAAYDEQDDYPDFAGAVGKKVSQAFDQSRGVLLCRNGAGVNFTANKFPHVRCVLGFSPDQVYDARHDDDVNVLAIPADFVDEAAAQKITEVFLSTPFNESEGRFRRRLMKVAQVEEEVRRME
ncbi:MAG: RpiB/LacA/LacB family sugar-phosphate isomerase [Candidatus Liptonbacteria bacterium]|nr:RpiB/LacA/LacB family sugar-phosphate isomerase [Candidatus Liptonbacteria bacterium]